MKRDHVPTPMKGHQQASAAVTAALGALDYPVTRADAIRQVGDWRVPTASGAFVRLGDILQNVPVDSFGDVGAAAAAVDRHWGRLAENVQALADAAQREKPGKPQKR